MQIQLPIRQAFAACLALLCMLSLNYIGFYAHAHVGIAMTILGKLALSVLSLGLGFKLYAQFMHQVAEDIVSAWPYALLILLADLISAYFYIDDHSPDQWQLRGIVLSMVICVLYASIKKLISYCDTEK